MTPPSQTYSQGVIFVLIATLGWSLSGLFVRLMPELNGFQINCWRGFWTSVSILCYLILVYGNRTGEVFRAIPPVALILSAGFFAFGSTMYVTSLTLVSTAVISVIGATSPIFAGLLSPAMTGERAGLASWIAALLALGGMGYIAWEHLEAGHWLGILVCLTVPASFAFQTLMLRRYRKVDMVPAICVGGVLAFIFSGLAGFFMNAGGGFNIGPKHMGLLAAMAVLQLSIPLIFYAKGAKTVPAITLALLSMMDGVLNPLWPWLFLEEVIKDSELIGGAVIAFAVLLSIFGANITNRRGAPKIHPPSGVPSP
jgi:drug/metabolite transporter, DME family